jgi:hypothetical protein
MPNSPRIHLPTICKTDHFTEPRNLELYDTQLLAQKLARNTLYNLQVFPFPWSLRGLGGELVVGWGASLAMLVVFSIWN